MHSNGRLWTAAVLALVLGVLAGGAAISIAERARSTKMQESLANVMQRLEESEGKVADLSQQLADAQKPSPRSQPASAPASPQPSVKPSRQFAFIRSIKTGNPGTIVLDYAEFLTGTEAAAAAKRAGEESPPPNDYFILNDSAKVRNLKIAADATVHLTSRPGEGSVAEGYDTSVSTLADYLATDTEETATLRADGYWITVANGVVTALEEQYTP